MEPQVEEDPQGDQEDLCDSLQILQVAQERVPQTLQKGQGQQEESVQA